jgi:hypothetical protein
MGNRTDKGDEGKARRAKQLANRAGRSSPSPSDKRIAGAARPGLRDSGKGHTSNTGARMKLGTKRSGPCAIRGCTKTWGHAGDHTYGKGTVTFKKGVMEQRKADAKANKHGYKKAD